MRFASFLAAFPLAAAIAQQTVPQPPTLAREFRAVWVATVTNMDWPSRAGLSTQEQQRELVGLLDRLAALKMNAIIFQVRPEADALYASELEPWSRYLTGKQGRAPSPWWDPLAFAVREAHARGIEVHAWFNPYRVAFWKDSARAPSHVSRRKPRLVVPYAQFLWMDPALPEVRESMIRVVLDVVKRYDVDGVHIDDYFYPYPETNRAGRTIEFPDAKSYAAYRRSGGSLDRDDWRRRNVNILVRDFYRAVKSEKPWVKVGISPFGIWRPGYPPTTTAGIDQYAELYADVKKWVNEGTLDYVAPQLYWPIWPPEQSYPVLLKWWVEQSAQGRHVWPGLALYKIPITGPKKMSPGEIATQVRLTRAQSGATGHIHFNARVLIDNVEGIADTLATLYAQPALVPGSPWLDSIAPPPPTVRVSRDAAAAIHVHFEPGDRQVVRWWVMQALLGGEWRSGVLPGNRAYRILVSDDAAAELIAVSAVDRAGNMSASTVTRVDRR